MADFETALSDLGVSLAVRSHRHDVLVVVDYWGGQLRVVCYDAQVLCVLVRCRTPFQIVATFVSFRGLHHLFDSGFGVDQVANTAADNATKDRQLPLGGSVRGGAVRVQPEGDARPHRDVLSIIHRTRGTVRCKTRRDVEHVHVFDTTLRRR